MNVHIYTERRKEGERDKGFFLCHEGTGWDEKTVSDLIEFMNIFLSSNIVWTSKNFYNLY